MGKENLCTMQNQIEFLHENRNKLYKFMEERGLFETKHIVNRIVDALLVKQRTSKFGFVIVHGCGGSGKSEITKAVLDFIDEHCSINYQTCTTDENTTTDTLIKRISADTLMSTTGEKYVYGEMGEGLKNGANIRWEELNRTPFENIQRMMTLLAERELTIHGEKFNIPDGCIILATANLGSKGTHPIAQEFKQRAILVKADYEIKHISKILDSVLEIEDKNKKKLHRKLLAETLFNITKEYAEKQVNGWNYEASIRTLKDFLEYINLSDADKDDIKIALENVLLQFTDETSHHTRRQNEALVKEILPKLTSIKLEDI